MPEHAPQRAVFFVDRVGEGGMLGAVGGRGVRQPVRLTLADDGEEAVGASYEAVVLAGDQAALIRQLENLPDAFAPLSFEVYRVVERGFVVFGWQEGPGNTAEDVEDLAKELSVEFGKAVAVHFHDMLQVRETTLYQGGESIRSFGEQDELWAPMDDNGEELPDAPRCPGYAVPDGAEYTFVWDGIDAGLEAAGFRSWLPTSAGLWPLQIAQREALIWERPGTDE
jgi:hypothetical protein